DWDLPTNAKFYCPGCWVMRQNRPFSEWPDPDSRRLRVTLQQADIDKHTIIRNFLQQYGLDLLNPDAKVSRR
ncbi:hypothetical protein KIPB_012674, partial [Kipferlia bialata]